MAIKAAVAAPKTKTKAKAKAAEPKAEGRKAKKPDIKFPKSLGLCADAYYELREKRKAAERIAAEIKRDEDAYKEHLISSIPKGDLSGVKGKLCGVTVVNDDVPQVEDWDAFYKYLAKTKEFDLMQRRLSAEAVELRWAQGKKVPGVKSFKVTKLSVSKL